MEHEPVPDAMHIPRATLADMLLPNSVYAVFPWRDATLLRFHGDQREWEMAWRYQQSASLDSLGTMFRGALADQSGWTFASEEKRGATWTSRWCIRRDGADDATGEVSLTREGRQIDLVMRVRRPGQPCQAGRS
jgi:hypothetical protein